MKTAVSKTLLLGFLFLVQIPTLSAVEMLGHISDENALVEQKTNSEQNDRRIIYRVICTPGGEVLPDCERPLNDTELLAQPEQQINQPESLESGQLQTEGQPALKSKQNPAKQTGTKKTIAGKKVKANQKSSKTPQKQIPKKPKPKKAAGKK